MKGDRPHAGFPERCFDRHAETLVNRGFKIGRVEQMETPNELKERNQSTGSKSKVVNRELCSVLTKGTLVDSNMIGHPNTSYLLAVCESKGSVEYGICLCDTVLPISYMSVPLSDVLRSHSRQHSFRLEALVLFARTVRGQCQLRCSFSLTTTLSVLGFELC